MAPKYRFTKATRLGTGLPKLKKIAVRSCANSCKFVLLPESAMVALRVREREHHVFLEVVSSFKQRML